MKLGHDQMGRVDGIVALHGAIPSFGIAGEAWRCCWAPCRPACCGLSQASSEVPGSRPSKVQVLPVYGGILVLGHLQATLPKIAETGKQARNRWRWRRGLGWR